MTQPTRRGRATQAAIDDAARAVIARKGILAATVADIAAEAGRSPASFYNYYDSKEAMVRAWAMRFRDEANDRAQTVTRHGLSDRERVREAAAAHWHTYRHRLAEMVSVSQLAMINADFAEHWAQMCEIPTQFITDMVVRAQRQGHCQGDDPALMASAIVSMLNQFCYVQLAGRDGRAAPEVDDDACIRTLSHIFYRAIFSKEEP
ncbi:TetR/AcrR family transcriptional regulator [Mycolicibacterium confluentis]|uniref:TetR family transcriptional regulator n=1 Tax=Mycolicibacterium confluentis TaxID=28047 RepID=A0A7I7Y252_9MYCO|nr:TetR/AcrR family transcriptional regulator [Mycolicibacterium confluentis]MCV7320674.1 TetR/AcrR family transcriptional regulator [Mycolicibacterium confluentis]ORV30318.1 TetR family transcriptional regulator [Mycolicibacterium confluentis]BBZ35718.1 TetR family transcriptional regulator [Mycolicibacterium confluentis]